MDDSIKIRINNQIFKYEVRLPSSGVDDNTFTLDFLMASIVKMTWLD